MSANFIFRIFQRYVSQDELRAVGPLIPAAWWIPQEREEQIRKTGLPLPPMAQGYVLLDTGAPGMTIDEDIARELNLKPIEGRTLETHGIGGRANLPLYNARLILPVEVLQGSHAGQPGVAMRIPLDAWGMSGMMAAHREWRHKAPDGSPLRVIGIIGRLFLQFTKITYNGLDGTVEILIDESSQHPK